MRIGPWEVLKGTDVIDLRTDVKKLSDEIGHLKATPYPNLDGIFGAGTFSETARFPLPPQGLYEAARNSNELAIIFSNLKREIFRNGYEFEPKYQSKCEQCGKEYEFETGNCEVCGFKTHPAAEEEVQRIKELFKDVNQNHHTFTDLMEMLEDDLQTVDELYLIMKKSYIYDDEGGIAGAKIDQLFRASPVIIVPLTDAHGLLGYTDEGKALVCPEHRDVIFYETPTNPTTTCPSCHMKLYNAQYRMTNRVGRSSVTTYYIEGEVIHENKYYPGIERGYSPIAAVWNKVEALRAMDLYVKEYYGKQRPPKGLLMVNTANEDQLRKAWETIKVETQGNPNLIHPIAVQSNSTRGQVAQFIDFMNKLSESQYVEIRREFTERIGSRFGVMPIFQGDLSQSGGLNNEGLQVTVTNRAIATGQQVWNNKVFPKLFKEMGIDDWELKLNPSEERDETAEIDRNLKRSQHAQMMLQMGFDVELEPDGENFKFSGEAKPMQPGQFGGGSFGQPGTSPFPDMSPGSEPAEGTPESVAQVAMAQFEKAKMPRRLSGSMKATLEKEFNELFSKLDYKRKPSKQQLRNLSVKLTGKIRKDFKGALKSEIEELYKKGMQDIEKELDIKLSFGQLDKDALEVIEKDNVFQGAFDEMGEKVRKDLLKTITQAYKEPKSISDITADLAKTIDGERYQLERIARTESHHISTVARSNSYLRADPKGEFMYKWIGPNDHRTTDICKELTQKMSAGVKRSDLKKLVNTIARAHGSKARDFTPHINCRHTFVRVVPSVSKSNTLRKDRQYLSPGEKPPAGANVRTGPKGGRYFDTGGAKEKEPESKPSREKPSSQAKPKDEADVAEHLNAMARRQHANYRLRDKPIEHFEISDQPPEVQERFDRAWETFKEKYPTDARRVQGINVGPGISFSTALAMGHVHINEDDTKDEKEIVSTLLHESFHLRTFMEMSSPDEWARGNNEFMAAAYPGHEEFERIKREGFKKSDYNYPGRLAMHGNSHASVGWMTKEGQENRFDVLMKVFGENKSPEVLDVGAGLGHLKKYMESKGMTPDYHGVEVEKEFVEAAAGNGVTNLVHSNFMDLDEEKKYDYVVASGTFNTADQDLLKAIPKMLRMAKKGVAFNFLKTRNYVTLGSYDIETVKKTIQEAGFVPDVLTDLPDLDSDAAVLVILDGEN